MFRPDGEEEEPLGRSSRPQAMGERVTRREVRDDEAGGYEALGKEEGAMTYTTEELVRREVGKLLRVDYPGKPLCLLCLVKHIRQTFSTGYTKSQIERAIDKVFESPGALTRLHTFICAVCGKTMPCLYAPRG
jgi:hypothetical protein